MSRPKVVALYESNYRQAARTLRAVADEVEAMEKEGEKVEVALVIKGNHLDVYAMGAADAGSAHILLACGQRKLENAVLAAYEGEKN